MVNKSRQAGEKSYRNGRKELAHSGTIKLRNPPDIRLGVEPSDCVGEARDIIMGESPIGRPSNGSARVGPDSENERFSNTLKIDANAFNHKVADMDEKATDPKGNTLYVWGGAREAFFGTKS